MKHKISAVIFVVAALWLSGCASGYCRTSKTPVQNVFVYKPDGSLQCGQGRAISPDEMGKELEAVKVVSVRKDNDGMLRPTVCGAATGQINVYELPYNQMGKALKLGFKELKK